MKHRTGFLFVLFLILSSQLTSAQITVRPPTGMATDPAWLEIDYHRVNITVTDQIAVTDVDMQFTNTGDLLAEGTFLFPLPADAAVDELTMWIDGTPIEAKILRADEARDIYDTIVRQYRDPALLEYIGNDVIQANVFPIPPGESRRIQITYSHIAQADNGLVSITYPLNVLGKRPVNTFSLHVSVSGQDTISNVYSPSHTIAISRTQDETAFTAGLEETNFLPTEDFTLYYGIASETINLNLLTYREKTDEDGFFMLLVQPPLKLEATAIQPRDLIIVLDQSGSMGGEKWNQAQQAATYVLQNLNSEDRFNVILFSTGWRIFKPEIQRPTASEEAIRWIAGESAAGGTDISGALTTALDMVTERPATILFLTDGLATEGITNTQDLLSQLQSSAPNNARIFTFGVGNDVDTFLLDGIVRNHRGTGTYVRPGERIEEKMASLYNKISAPVMNDIALEFSGDVMTELLYPTQLPDLFAGEQLTIVGRYRGTADNVTLTLSGTVDDQHTSFVYEGHSFPEAAHGEAFIARLWATRRIGDLLNTIRLNGENAELVDSIVSLSLRYGIITPYTSFLIEEDDILSQQGRDRALEEFERAAEGLADTFTGSAAVDAAVAASEMESASAPAGRTALPSAAPSGGASDSNITQQNPIQNIQGKTFILQNNIWTDTQFLPDTMETVRIEFLSDAYFDLLTTHRELGTYLALGEQVIVVIDDIAYEIFTP